MAAAVHQMRMRFSRARAAISAGMITARKCSNGTLSRKKKLSLVVIASITATSSGAAAGEAFSLATSSVRLENPCLRATGSRRLSARYCFSADSTKPERWRSIWRR